MRAVFLFPFLILLTACSSLRVQVGVLNPEVIRERAANDRLASTMPMVMAETPTSVAQFFADRLNIHAGVYDDIRSAYSTEAKKHPANSDAANVLNVAANDYVFPQSLRDDYNFWEKRALFALDMLQQAWPDYQATKAPAEGIRLRNRLIAGLDELEAIHDAVDVLIVSDLDLAVMQERLAKLPPELRSSVVKQIQRNVKAQVAAKPRQLFDPGNIQHSPYAYYVAKAPDADWAAKFDESWGGGIFGNTDIAIKAIGPGNFTIKGVSFNPSDVAITAAKVTSQTVLLAAQIAGVPVKLSGAPDAAKPGSALAQSSQAVGQALTQSETVDVGVIAHRDALHRIAAALVRERQLVLSGSNAQRRNALDSIKAVYRSQVARLRVSTD